jgi:nucleoside 2-deoxyribosyltransferase
VSGHGNPAAPLLYLAGPLFNVAERRFNLELTSRLEAVGYRVFLPQRDGAEGTKEPYASMSKDERRAVMFATDRDTIYGCDVFLFVLDGRVPDEGACVELGLAYAHRQTAGRPRRLVGVQTDARAAFMGSRLNPMIRVALDEIYETVEELVDALTMTAR